MHLVEWKLNKQSKMIQSKGCHFHWLICVCDGTRGRKFLYRVAATLSPRDLARVNSDKRHGPKCSDSVENEIATTDNLLWPNCDSDGKADNKQQAFINTTTRRFKIQTGDMGPTPLPPPSPPYAYVTYLLLGSLPRVALRWLHWIFWGANSIFLLNVQCIWNLKTMPVNNEDDHL